MISDTMTIPWKRVLVLAPHTDDAELGCGGTIARLLDEDIDVHVAVFSIAEDSVPQGKPPTMIQNEFYEAMKIMGLPENQIKVYRYPVRHFFRYRQEILDNLIELRKQINPDWVLLPASTDCHQDHEVISAEGTRAFKKVSIWGYELPWNHLKFSCEAFISFSQKHLDKKLAALQAYRSQVELERPYFSKDFITGLAATRGVQVDRPFAECYEVLRINL